MKTLISILIITAASTVFAANTTVGTLDNGFPLFRDMQLKGLSNVLKETAMHPSNKRFTGQEICDGISEKKAGNKEFSFAFNRYCKVDSRFYIIGR